MVRRSSSARVALVMASTTYRAGAFLEAARHLGVETVVASDRSQALAFANPRGHLTLDFENPAHAVRDLVAFGNEEGLDAVLATDDEGVEIAAAAAGALGLRHSPPHAVAKTRNKRALREALAQAGFRGPWFRVLSSAEPPESAAGEVVYPCVLKPVGLAASRGVIRADDPSGFVTAYRRIVRLLSGRGAEPTILVESYLPGAEVAIEALQSDGRMRVLAIFDKPDPLEGPFFEESIFVTPSRLSPAAQADAVRVAEQAAVILGLDQGPLHVELRIHEDRAWLLEIASRSIGGLCSRALRFGDGGVSLEELILRNALGEDVSGIERESQASGVMMIPIPRAGVLHEVRGIDAASAVSGVDEVRMTIPLGQEVVPWPEGSRYLGFIFARAARPEAAEQALREAHRRLTLDIRQDAAAIESMAHSDRIRRE